MMFLNCQKPGLIKDPYIYRPDSIMLDLEDAVAENQKDAARYSLYHALQEIDYRGVERVVRINGLDTPHWKEDIRVCVAGGADVIRIAKTESGQDVRTVEEHVLAAEKEFGRPEEMCIRDSLYLSDRYRWYQISLFSRLQTVGAFASKGQNNRIICHSLKSSGSFLVIAAAA